MTSEQNIQLHDREQFRRYAEAALGGIISTGLDCPNLARTAFSIATAMMLAESQSFEGYQLMSAQVAIDEERKRQGIKPPYTDFS